jgi:hypothetical protein
MSKHFKRNAQAKNLPSHGLLLDEALKALSLPTFNSYP